MSESLPITFPLPPDGRPTRLSGHPVCYWELEVEADMPGVDYQAYFLLPVYE